LSGSPQRYLWQASVETCNLFDSGKWTPRRWYREPRTVAVPQMYLDVSLEDVRPPDVVTKQVGTEVCPRAVTKIATANVDTTTFDIPFEIPSLSCFDLTEYGNGIFSWRTTAPSELCVSWRQNELKNFACITFFLCLFCYVVIVFVCDVAKVFFTYVNCDSFQPKKFALQIRWGPHSALSERATYVDVASTAWQDYRLCYWNGCHLSLAEFISDLNAALHCELPFSKDLCTKQGRQTMARGPNPAREAVSSGRKDISKKMCWFGRM